MSALGCSLIMTALALNMSLTMGDRLGSLGLPVVNVERRIENDGRVTGMWVTFANRMTLSIQWHSGSYSNVGRGYWKPGQEPEVEAAAWFPEEFDTPSEFGPRRRWFKHNPRYDGDDVLPYATIPDVIEFARAVAGVVLDVANIGKALALVAKL